MENPITMGRNTINYMRGLEVVKRNGTREKVSFDKIIRRIEGICDYYSLKRIDPIEVAKDTVQGIFNGITTEELDFFASVKCADKILDDPEYNTLAAGLCISDLQKMTSGDFMEVTDRLYNNKDRFGHPTPLVTDEYYAVVKTNIDRIKKEIDYNRDFLFDFFGIKTLERAYLSRLKDNKYNQAAYTGTSGTSGVAAANKVTKDKKNDNKKDDDEESLRNKYGRIIERPQDMLMRVSIGIHGTNIDLALDTYHHMSQQYFIHASPTLFNSGAPRSQLSSCFLLSMDDNLEHIFDTVKNVALISKLAGGIGISLSDIRGKGSLIRGTNGNSDGIIPLIRLLNSEGRYVNQGGRRNGAIAVYIEVWHSDIYEFCDLRKNTGTEELRARDIFLGLWVCDLFMKRVEEDGYWSIMCPDECPGLTTSYGEAFEQLYVQYEKEGRYKKRVKAEDLWFHILSAQIETGMPYMLYKDNVNKQSNQKNLGTIKCSNLCSEIVQYTATDEISVCNLCSICLPKYVQKDETGTRSYDFKKLCHVAEIATVNLNKIIDINYYPVNEAKNSNLKHRPIGVGVQGWSDALALMEYPFESVNASLLNRQVFETIYYGCLKASCDLAKKEGPYESFLGSPFSEGHLQFHLWGLSEDNLATKDMWDWDQLRQDIMKYGTRNSLLTALMPTA